MRAQVENRLQVVGTQGDMAKSSVSSSEFLILEETEVPTATEISTQLRIVLASPAFQGSKRSQQFLEYVCKTALAGEVESLKERRVAVEVFGRRPESDLSEDTIVRVSAREVRKRIVQFYASPEGLAAPVVIDLPSGAYAPEFRHAAKEAAKSVDDQLSQAPTASAAEMETLVEKPISRVKRPVVFVATAAVLLAALVAGLMQWRINDGHAAFRSFWDPVFRSPEPLLIAVAHPLVYHPSSRAYRLNEERLPHLAVPAQRPLGLRPEELNGSDMVAVQHQYVGFGDMIAATNVAGMLGHRSKNVLVRFASSVQFGEMKHSPTLLIGASTNRWTMELEQSWKFQFARTTDSRAVIIDAQDGKPPNTPAERRRHWGVRASDDGSVPEDMFLICRVYDPTSKALLLVGAGLKQFGTEAAGQLLVDPAQLSAILGKLRPGWEDKNLQIVLRTKVIGNGPARPEVVDWHVW